MAKVSTPAPEKELKELRRQFARRDYSEVLLIAGRLAESGNLSDAARVMAGEAATKIGEPAAAVEYYGRVKESSEKYPVAQLATGELFRDQGRVSAAERAYQAAVTLRPRNSIAHSRLAMFALSTGRAFKARQHLEVLLQQRTISWSELCRLAATERATELEDYFIEALQENGADELVILGAAERFMHRGEFDRCDEIFDIGSTPLSSRIAAARLKCCLLDGRHPQVPDNLHERFQEFESPEHADGLFVLGATLEANQYIDDAILCFARCLQFGDHLAASQHLLTLLKARGGAIELAPLRKRVELLGRVHAILDSLQLDVVNPVAALELANIMMELGRYDEAVAWFAAAGRPETPVFEENADSSTALDVVLDACLVLHPELSSEVVATQSDSSQVAAGSLVQRFEGPLFRDIANDVGILFEYFESPDEETEGRRMFEFTGGGVGVVDVDNDSWPDLYFAQGTDWPPSEKNDRWSDVLYRNLRGERAEDVSDASGVTEFAFGQGVSCGDLNNDGFTDIVVANIGVNTWWLNQGDGTFLRVVGGFTASSQWTSSVAIADLNVDGNADVFEVNYITGRGFDTLICETPAGPRVCAPLAFQPTLDRLLLGTGEDALFTDSTPLGLNTPGNGLGLLVANLDTDQMLEVFVANDAMPNALWDNTTGAGEIPSYVDVAASRGVAVGSEGKAQACMGIASADFDANGTTDLFVTNYFNESNAFYIFEKNGYAVDQSTHSNIRRMSHSLLGFGAQAFDADSDGDYDILLVNGDLDDFSHEGRTLRMPPQLMINNSNGTFRQLVPTSDDSFLNESFRGRGLARLDWNRDCQWEFVVSCLDQPAKLISLTQRATAPRVSVNFVGIKSSRGAVGVSLRNEESNQAFELTGGSGYLASNQPSLSLTPGAYSIQWSANVAHRVTLSSRKLQTIVEERSASYPIPR